MRPDVLIGPHDGAYLFRHHAGAERRAAGHGSFIMSGMGAKPREV